jgi:hypothetical protein
MNASLRRVVVDLDPEISQRAGDVDSPVLESFDGAEEFEAGVVELLVGCFGVVEGMAVGVVCGYPEYFAGFENCGLEDTQCLVVDRHAGTLSAVTS